MSKKISLRHRLEFFGYSTIERVILSLPDYTLPNVSRFFAFLAFYLLQIRRNVSIQNLKLAFPNKSPKWYKRMAYFSYVHFGMVILEFMKMQKWTAEKINSKICEVDAEEFFKKTKQRKGAILVSGHFGNWEIAMAYIYLQGILSAVIQQRQNNILVNNKMTKLRKKWGMSIIYPGGAVDASVKMLKQGYLLGILGDQDAGERGTIISFFGQKSSTHVGAASLHVQTGVPIFHGSCIRLSANSFKLKISRIPNLKKKHTLNDGIQEITQKFTLYLQNEVERYPEQYFWMHRRWKTFHPDIQ
jgi:KDO2-lipid IV(A) lauroyltransferase